MTGTNESEETSDIKQQDQLGDVIDQEQSPEEAEASFAAGFEAVSDTATLGDTKPAEEAPVTSTTSADSQSIGEHYDMSPEEARANQKKIRRLEGQYGALKDSFEELKLSVNAQPAGATEQQQEELQAGLKNLKDIEASIGEFVELTPIKNELESQARDIAEVRNLARNRQPQESSLSSNDVTELVNDGVMNVFHPNWKQTAETAEFRSFMLQGGPSEESYAEYATAGRDPNTNEGEFVEDWKADFPDWWRDKGDALFSNDTSKSIGMLDRYEAAKASADDNRTAQEQVTQRRERRLRSGIQPAGVSADAATGISDDEAFARGFGKVRAKSAH